MNRKFAVLNFIESRDEINLKYKILKKAPTKIFDWYIYKFNPYKIEEITCLGQEGYSIKLPVMKTAAESEPEKVSFLIEKTVESLLDYNVLIIRPPNEPELSYPEKISIATGRDIMPFFLPQAIRKALKTVQKDIKTADILLIGGNELTESVLYNIYDEINYLSLMTADEDVERYAEAADLIFEDNGLNVQLAGVNKSILGLADIVINTGGMDERFFYGFKRGAVIFDLSNERSMRMELMRKREDLLVVDDFRLKWKDEMFTSVEFELPFYVSSREYRAIYVRGYDHEIAKSVKSQLDELDVNVVAFKNLDNIINSVSINKFHARLGLSEKGNPNKLNRF